MKQNLFGELLALIAILAFAGAARAQHSPADMKKMKQDFCDKAMNFSIGLTSTAAEIEGGKLKINQKHPDYISMDGGKKVRIKSEYERYEEMLVLPTDVVFEQTDSSVKLSRRAALGSKLTSIDVVGYEAKFKTSEPGECELVQNAAIFQTPKGEVKRLVFDKDYCDKVRGILARQGTEAVAREKLRTCTDFLGEAQEVFNKRKAELLKENITMSDAVAPFFDPTVGRAEQSGAWLVLGLMAMCTPQNWTQFGAEMRMEMMRGTPGGPSGQRPTTK